MWVCVECVWGVCWCGYVGEGCVRGSLGCGGVVVRVCEGVWGVWGCVDVDDGVGGVDVEMCVDVGCVCVRWGVEVWMWVGVSCF